MFVCVCNQGAYTDNSQGTESSDLSLISDFFPPPRTILEISVNLKRNFFLGGGGGGMGIGVK